MKIYKPKEAAEILGISKDYLKKLLLKNKIKGFKIGDTKYSHWRIREDALLEFINK